MSFVTPLDPAALPGARAKPRAVDVQRAVRSTLFARIGSAVASSCGSDHTINEDAHSTLDRSTAVYVVADGVGGGAMAGMASRLLVAYLQATLRSDCGGVSDVQRAVLDADRAVAQSIAEVTDAPGAATVALCAPVNARASTWLIAWVGDCRVYRLPRGRALQPLTADDTFENLNEAPPPGGSVHDPARMVGNGAVVSANVAFTELGLGDLLVVCSDGVHKHIEAQHWAILSSRALTLDQRCEALIGAARTNGSTDDATVLVVQRSAPAALCLAWNQRDGDANGAGQ